MQIGRLIRHAASAHWRTRMKFPPSTLDAIEQAISRAEKAHAGEIRFAIETALSPQHIVQGLAPRARARDVFGSLRVWDTEHNNGVLIYVLLADRDVEIVADRGFEGRVSAADWETVCRLMEGHFRAGGFEAGAIAGVDAVGALLMRHFPRGTGPSLNELPDRPTLL